MVTPKNYSQVCVLEGYTVDSGKEFERIIKSRFGKRVKFLEIIHTNPDLDDQGQPVPETGGRSDIFFSVHDKDSISFAMAKQQIGARWFEDVVMNGGRYLYPDRVMDYYGWDGDELELIMSLPPNKSIYM